MSDAKTKFTPYPNGVKFCTKCRQKKPLVMFNKSKGHIGGIYQYCAICQATAQREYRDRKQKRESKW